MKQKYTNPNIYKSDIAEIDVLTASGETEGVDPNEIDNRSLSIFGI